VNRCHAGHSHLIDVGLATATAERLVAGNKAIEFAAARITEAGRQQLSIL
jgi:hypothetical protein